MNIKRESNVSKHKSKNCNESIFICFRSAQFQQGRTVDALTLKDDEGRCRVRKASARSQTIYDPGVSEWGNPSRVTSGYHELNT